MEKKNTYLNKLRGLLASNKFLRNVAILVGGTAFAQFLVILASPIITRLYTPEDFGVLAIFISIVATLGSATSLKYYLAIPLPSKDEDAIQLLALCLIINVFYGLVTALLFYLLTPLIKFSDNLKIIIPYLWIIPISVTALGFYQSFKYWAIRESKFKHIARTKISQNLTLIGAQIGIGLFYNGPIGLLFGDAVGRSGGTSTLAFLAWEKIRLFRNTVSIKSIKNQAIRYKRFPIYSSSSGIFNSLGLHITPLLIAAILGPAVAGFYALTQRVSSAPLKLIGQSYSQVYYKEAADTLKISSGSLKKLFIKQSKILMGIGSIPTITLFLLGQDGFEFIFGNKWGESGLYAQILAPMLLIQFVVVPLSQTLNIIEKQNFQLLWDIARFCCVAAIFLMIYQFQINPTLSIFLISSVMLILYSILFIITYIEINR